MNGETNFSWPVRWGKMGRRRKRVAEMDTAAEEEVTEKERKKRTERWLLKDDFWMLFSAEAFDIFSGEVSESSGNSWSDFFGDSCGWSNCESEVVSDVLVVTDVCVLPPSLVSVRCEGVFRIKKTWNTKEHKWKLLLVLRKGWCRQCRSSTEEGSPWKNGYCKDGAVFELERQHKIGNCWGGVWFVGPGGHGHWRGTLWEVRQEEVQTYSMSSRWRGKVTI